MAIYQNQKYNSLPEQVQENKDNIEFLQENAMFQWNPLGTWSATKFYKKNDLVVDGDYGTFLCINDTEMAGTEPKDNPNFWVKVIQAGKQGQPGEMGPRGNSIESVETVSHSNTGDETVTRAQINFSLGNSNEISIYAKNGAKGNTGATGPQGLTGTGLSHITMGTPYISGDKTVTPLNFEYTDGTSQELAAYAQNGAGKVLCEHSLILRVRGATPFTVTVNVITSTITNYNTLSELIADLRAEVPYPCLLYEDNTNDYFIDSMLINSKNPLSISFYRRLLTYSNGIINVQCVHFAPTDSQIDIIQDTLREI